MGERLARHIEELCLTYGIRVVERRSYGGVAYPRIRTIAIKPVRTQRTYVVALHEIGHIVGKGRGGRKLEQEAAAWDFVLETSIVPFSVATYRRMLVYLESYVARAHRRRRMVLPDPDNRFWKTYALIRQRAEPNIE